MSRSHDQISCNMIWVDYITESCDHDIIKYPIAKPIGKGKASKKTYTKNITVKKYNKYKLV